MEAYLRSSLIALMSFVLAIGCTAQASAQQKSLKEQITGAWSLSSGWEEFSDGKKNVPWAAGNLILEPTGHLSLMLVGKDRHSESKDSRIPTGPFVAYYGTYTVNEADKTISYKIEHAASLLTENVTRAWKITFNGDAMRTTGGNIQSPQGQFTPINEWKRVK